MLTSIRQNLYSPGTNQQRTYGPKRVDPNVVVLVNLCKELIEFPAWNNQPSPLKSCLQLFLVQLSIMISIYRFEQGSEFLLGMLYECTKF